MTERLEERITIINTDTGEVINRFGKFGSKQEEFYGPEGVALTQDGHIRRWLCSCCWLKGI